MCPQTANSGQTIRSVAPPSTRTACPTVYGSAPTSSAATTRPTSSGSPQRGTGAPPSAKKRSYRSRERSVISVRMIPGLTSYTAIPCGASRAANSWAAIAAPALETQYSPRFSASTSAFIEVTNTTPRGNGPAGSASSRLANAWVRKKAPRVLTARQRSKLSGLTSSRSPRLSTVTPALLTSPSTPPNAAQAASNSRPCPARSATSPCTTAARPPTALTSATTPAASSAAERSTTTRSKPRVARATAWARPRPRPAPVTIATGRGRCWLIRILLSRPPRPCGTQVTFLPLLAEEVVVVEPAWVDRRRELLGRHPAQPRVAVPELRAGRRLRERPRARGLEHASVERPAAFDPVQLARERPALAPSHDARGHEPPPLSPTP